MRLMMRVIDLLGMMVSAWFLSENLMARDWLWTILTGFSFLFFTWRYRITL